MNGILLLILSRHKDLNGLFKTTFDFQSTDTTTNWNAEEDLSSKDEALFNLFEPFENLSSMDATTNWSVEEAVCLKDKAFFVFASA